MPLDIQLEPYILESVLARDSYLTHYQATGTGRSQFIATEFYPTYMADRAPDGSLKISERFTKEFEAELESFRQRANHMSETQGAILPIQGVINRNNTVYVVRRACSFTTVDSYMQGQRMGFDEAFQFIRPLLLSLATSQANGVVFTFTSKDLRVTPQRQLMLDATFSWDLNFHSSIIEVMRLYFKLVTGASHTKEKSTLSSYGITVPARLEEIVAEVLSGADLLYGSLDDFYKKFKFVLDLETGSGAGDVKSTSSRVLGSAATVLMVLALVSLGGLVYGGVLAYRSSAGWANPNRFADAARPVPRFDFTAAALTHPRDSGDAVGGSFHFHDVFLFYRSDWNRPVLARRRIEERNLQIPGTVASEAEYIFIDNVRPSFINTWKNGSGDSYIFFSDGLSGNAVYRATLDGLNRNPVQISRNTALHLVVLGDYLYYSNHDDNHFMYRIDLNTLDERLILRMPIFGAVTDGERLYYLSGGDGGPFGVFMLDPNDPDAGRQLAAGAGMVLVYANGLLYFNDAEGHVHVIDTEGGSVSTYNEISVHTFTVDGNWLLFTEPGRLQPRALNMRNGERITLDASVRLAYIWARNGVLYGIDHVYADITHMIQLP